MCLKSSINCVLCLERMLFHYVRVKDGLKHFDRKIFRLEIRHEPAGQLRLKRIK